MKFAYTMDQVLRCGGVRVPFEHCRELIRRGHEAAIYHTGGIGTDIQDWIERYGVKVLPIIELEKGTDVLISVWWRQLDELLKYPAKQRYHLVQGQDMLSYPENHEWRPLNEQQMHRTDYEYLAVSPWAGESCRDPHLVPNGVDTGFWKPLAFPALSAKFRILIEASTGDESKGMAEALEVVRRMKEAYPDKIECWAMRANGDISGTPIIDRIIMAPTDRAILNSYQNAHLLLKTSWFDGFGLPHLEAMACGLPLVTTDAGGNMSFCKDNFNCLVAKPKDVDGLFSLAQKVYELKPLRNYLVEGGFDTANRWNWQRSVDCLLDRVNHRNN